MKQQLIAAVALAVMMAFSACNTVRGVGQDVRSLGRGIERSSDTR